MEAFIDYEYLSGAHGEEVIKDLSVAADNVLETSFSTSLLHGGSRLYGEWFKMRRREYRLCGIIPNRKRSHGNLCSSIL